jgi:hypothetical protein
MGELNLKIIIHQKKFKFGFTRIWPLNPKAMDNKTRPSKVYIELNLNNVRNEEEYTTENEAENNPQWGEESIITKLLHIVETHQHLKIHLSTS